MINKLISQPKFQGMTKCTNAFLDKRELVVDFIQQTSIWVAFKHPISAHHIHNVLMQIGGL
ncbi:hypothetical protein [Xenorhabdus siamensis]|uniref:hypothetical protein n=1 Tax=Xenorhabdus siamensis TaxID=3136254 RepID=UPI0030F3DAE1